MFHQTLNDDDSSVCVGMTSQEWRIQNASEPPSRPP